MMTGFSTSWLALREPADHRARDGGLAERLAAHFSQYSELHSVDLGAGTGSNLRASCSFLGKRQHWTLIDHDATLLSHARITLLSWADEDYDDGQVLHLKKGAAEIRVEFRAGDLAADLETLLPERFDLLTASALFDLVSPQFIKRVAKAVQLRSAVVYAVLTYNGQMAWTPRHPLDNAVRGAFHAHQLGDKGFGPAAGPTAGDELADALAMAGYSVSTASSDWVLQGADHALIGLLADGYATAATENGAMPSVDIEKWRSVTRTGSVVGHTDLLAFPPEDSNEDADDRDFDDDNSGDSDGL